MGTRPRNRRISSSRYLDIHQTRSHIRQDIPDMNWEAELSKLFTQVAVMDTEGDNE